MGVAIERLANGNSFQQERKQPWEIAAEKFANKNSERFDKMEASMRNMEVQLGQIVNSMNFWDPKYLPSQ